MGAMLSSPVELIRVQRHGNKFFRGAVADMQGWRNNHEDGHAIRCEESLGSFWVLDGHGGDKCSIHCSPKLGEEFVKGGFSDDERIERGFHEVDESFRKTGEESGTTVVGCIAQRQDDGAYTIKLANCGDSRALIVRGPDAAEDCAPLEVRLPQHLTTFDGCMNVAAAASATYNPPNANGNHTHSCRWPLIAESVDHKPSHPTETARIQAAGGFVSAAEPARLDGNLAVSRCLGDFEYKADENLKPAQQKVSCVPDIYEVQNVPAGSFIVLACDGLWDVCTGEYVAEYIRTELKKDARNDLGEIASSLVWLSMKERSTKDNVTLMIIQLTDGSSWSCVPDEMKNWEKLVNSDSNMEDDVRTQYSKFLEKCNFPDEPYPCSQCKTWISEVGQCPVTGAYYCCKHCQKKGWKQYKASLQDKASQQAC